MKERVEDPSLKNIEGAETSAGLQEEQQEEEGEELVVAEAAPDANIQNVENDDDGAVGNNNIDDNNNPEEMVDANLDRILEDNVDERMEDIGEHSGDSFMNLAEESSNDFMEELEDPEKLLEDDCLEGTSERVENKNSSDEKSMKDVVDELEKPTDSEDCTGEYEEHDQPETSNASWPSQKEASNKKGGSVHRELIEDASRLCQQQDARIVEHLMKHLVDQTVDGEKNEEQLEYGEGSEDWMDDAIDPFAEDDEYYNSATGVGRQFSEDSMLEGRLVINEDSNPPRWVAENHRTDGVEIGRGNEEPLEVSPEESVEEIQLEEGEDVLEKENRAEREEGKDKEKDEKKVEERREEVQYPEDNPRDEVELQIGEGSPVGQQEWMDEDSEGEDGSFWGELVPGHDSRSQDFESRMELREGDEGSVQADHQNEPEEAKTRSPSSSPGPSQEEIELHRQMAEAKRKGMGKAWMKHLEKNSRAVLPAISDHMFDHHRTAEKTILECLCGPDTLVLVDDAKNGARFARVMVCCGKTLNVKWIDVDDDDERQEQTTWIEADSIITDEEAMSHPLKEAEFGDEELQDLLWLRFFDLDRETLFSGKKVYELITIGSWIEVQLEEQPFLVTYAKVVDNRGGLLLVAYDKTLKWIHMFDPYCHFFGWALSQDPDDFEHEQMVVYTAWCKKVNYDQVSELTAPAVVFNENLMRRHELDVGDLIGIAMPENDRIYYAHVTRILDFHFFMVSTGCDEEEGGISLKEHGPFHIDSPKIYPVEYLEKVGVELEAPPGVRPVVKDEKFGWKAYRKLFDVEDGDFVEDCGQLDFEEGEEITIATFKYVEFMVVHSDDLNDAKEESTKRLQPREADFGVTFYAAEICRSEGGIVWILPHCNLGMIVLQARDLRLFPCGTCVKYGLPIHFEAVVERMPLAGEEKFSNEPSYDPDNRSKQFIPAYLMGPNKIMPRLYVNKKCITGEYYDNELIQRMPDYIEQGSLKGNLKLFFKRLMVAVKPDHRQLICNIFEKTIDMERLMSVMTIKYRCDIRDPTSTLRITTCEFSTEVPRYLMLICLATQTCPNLFSLTETDSNEGCPFGCHRIKERFEQMLFEDALEYGNEEEEEETFVDEEEEEEEEVEDEVEGEEEEPVPDLEERRDPITIITHEEEEEEVLDDDDEVLRRVKEAEDREVQENVARILQATHEKQTPEKPPYGEEFMLEDDEEDEYGVEEMDDYYDFDPNEPSTSTAHAHLSQPRRTRKEYEEQEVLVEEDSISSSPMFLQFSDVCKNHEKNLEERMKKVVAGSLKRPLLAPLPPQLPPKTLKLPLEIQLEEENFSPPPPEKFVRNSPASPELFPRETEDSSFAQMAAFMSDMQAKGMFAQMHMFWQNMFMPFPPPIEIPPMREPTRQPTKSRAPPPPPQQKAFRPAPVSSEVLKMGKPTVEEVKSWDVIKLTDYLRTNMLNIGSGPIKVLLNASISGAQLLSMDEEKCAVLIGSREAGGRLYAFVKYIYEE